MNNCSLDHNNRERIKIIALTGGGTGGHIYPAIAIKELIHNHNPNYKFVYIGQENGLEGKIVVREPEIKFLGIRACGMPRELSVKWFDFIYKNILGIIDAYKHLLRIKPQLLIATGGFVSFPALFCATVLGIPFIIHEQNAVLGFTNRLFAYYARKILLSYQIQTLNNISKCIHTGNPVRQAFFRTAKQNLLEIEKKEGEIWILVVGGSRGARSINNAVLEIPDDWWKHHNNVKLIHITGESFYNEIAAKVKKPNQHFVFPYLHDMKSAFDTVDFVVSRAGATILAELAVCAKPAILIPYPYATDNHQEKNSRLLEQQKAALVILDKELSGIKLAQTIDQMLDKTKLEMMSLAMKNSRPQNVEEKIWLEIYDVLKMLES